jgi:hypothetical protein
LNPYAARAATESTSKELGIAWVTGNALVFRPEKPVDIVVSSLMAHHLEDEEIVALLRWMEATAQAGWFINDLERSEWSCRMFAWVERIAGWHRFVRHDGPASFRRAFREEDWVRLLTAAEVPLEAVTVEHWRPGRLCVGRWKWEARPRSGVFPAQLASYQADRSIEVVDGPKQIRRSRFCDNIVKHRSAGTTDFSATYPTPEARVYGGALRDWKDRRPG